MAGSGVRTYRWQRRKERAVEGDARRIFQGDRKIHTCLPTIMFASLSESQPCRQSGLPSHAFYPVALKISSSYFSRFLSISKMPDNVGVVLSSLRHYS